LSIFACNEIYAGLNSRQYRSIRIIFAFSCISIPFLSILTRNAAVIFQYKQRFSSWTLLAVCCSVEYI